jgi:hypothetical protein
MPWKRTGAPENDAGEGERVVEALGDLDRVLADHGVDHEENVLRFDGGFDARELGHQALVDRESPGGVVDDDVVAVLLGFGDRRFADLERALVRNVEHRDADARAEHLKLLDGRGPLHVGRDEKRLFPLFDEVARELRGGGRFAGALEAYHHDAGRTFGGEREGLALGGHEGDELVVADLRELIARADAHRLPVGSLGAHADDFAERFFLHAGEERLGHAELDVGLEQGEPHFAQRGVDVLLVQLRETRQAIFCLSKAVGEGVKHGACLPQFAMRDPSLRRRT